jgi:hypothetical protein
VSILLSLNCRDRPSKAIHCQRRTQQTSSPIQHKKVKLLVYNQRGPPSPTKGREQKLAKAIVLLEIPPYYQYMALCVSVTGWKLEGGIGDRHWRTPPLRKLENKAKACRSRNTPKLSVYDSVCVSQLMEAGGAIEDSRLENAALTEVREQSKG